MGKLDQEFERPSIILEEYPELREYFTANDLGYMLKLHLIRGRKLTRGCEVSVKDVFKLIEFRNQIKAA